MGFSVYSCFLYQYNWPSLYNWNIVESGVKHHKPNHKLHSIILNIIIQDMFFMYEIYFINNIYCHPWVLVKIPRDQTHRAAQRAPGWWIEWVVSRGLSGYNTESLTVDYSGCRVWIVQHSLHAKDLFYREKSVGAL